MCVSPKRGRVGKLRPAYGEYGRCLKVRSADSRSRVPISVVVSCWAHSGSVNPAVAIASKAPKVILVRLFMASLLHWSFCRLEDTAWHPPPLGHRAIGPSRQGCGAERLGPGKSSCSSRSAWSFSTETPFTMFDLIAASMPASPSSAGLVRRGLLRQFRSRQFGALRFESPNCLHEQRVAGRLAFTAVSDHQQKQRGRAPRVPQLNA